MKSFHHTRGPEPHSSSSARGRLLGWLRRGGSLVSGPPQAMSSWPWLSPTAALRLVPRSCVLKRSTPLSFTPDTSRLLRRAPEVRILELDPGELGVGEVRMRQLRLRHVGAGEVGAVDLRFGEV